MFLLWLIAVAIGLYGIVRISRGDTLLGVLLIVAAFLVGPGGYSIVR